MTTEDEIISRDLAENRDDLSERDLGAQFTQLLLLKTRKAGMQERHVIIKERPIANAFMLGHPINGLLGTTGVGLGVGTRGDFVTSRVVNPNRAHIDNLFSTIFQDTTNAIWNTTTGEISFGTNQTATSLPVYLNNETLSSATMKPTISGTGSIGYLLSADGGTNFESVTTGSAHVFTNPGSDLRWRITGTNVTVSQVIVTY